MVTQGESYGTITSQLASLDVNTSERSIRRALKRWGVTRPGSVAEHPGITIEGDDAEATSKVSTGFTTPEDLMLERGLDPDEWDVASMTVNEWDAPTGDIMRQLKCQLKRKQAYTMVTPARVGGPAFKPKKVAQTKPRFIVFCGDQQAPYYEESLHKSFCNWLHAHKPDEGVLIGDTIDLPDISRHPSNPEWHVTTQECIDAGYLVLRDYRTSHEPTQWQKLAGNHDERLRRAVIDRLNEIYGLRRARVPGEEPDSPLVDVEHLLRLDELGIEYVRPNGDYEHTQIKVSTYLAARHGWIARKGSGTSALATLEHLGFSVVVGHTHRQSLVHKTRHDINGSLETLAACETGCMCRIRDGLGYAVAPDWQNGFATATVWPNGTFKIDLATYVDGTLYYQNERY